MLTTFASVKEAIDFVVDQFLLGGKSNLPFLFLSIGSGENTRITHHTVASAPDRLRNLSQSYESILKSRVLTFMSGLRQDVYAFFTKLRREARGRVTHAPTYY